MAARLPERLRVSAEDGFGIIEVLVSALLVVMVSTGVFVAFDGATKASGTNKARSVASNVARTDQERLRGLTPEALATLPVNSSQNVDGKTFSIESRTEWVADRTGEPTCSSADGKTDYLKLRSSVTWPDMGPLAPVVSESLRAIPKGDFRPNQGSVAVKVTDRNDAPVSGATVSLSAGGFTRSTNSLGCVLFDQVPVGTYTVTATKANYVTPAYPNSPAFTKSVNVAKEETSSVPATLDLAGTARASFRSTSTVGGAENSTTGSAFTIQYVGLISPTQRSFTLDPSISSNGTLYSGTGSAAVTSSATRTVFPFTAAYTVWAGGCPEANPAVQVPPQPAQPLLGQIVPPGGVNNTSANYNVREPRMEILVKRYTTSAQVSTSTSNVTGQRVRVEPVVESCTRAINVTTSSSGIAALTEPYGEYEICAQDSTSSTSARRRRGVIRVNKTAGGTSYNVLYNNGATQPANGAIILPFAASASTPC